MSNENDGTQLYELYNRDTQKGEETKRMTPDEAERQNLRLRSQRASTRWVIGGETEE